VLVSCASWLLRGQLTGLDCSMRVWKLQLLRSYGWGLAPQGMLSTLSNRQCAQHIEQQWPLAWWFACPGPWLSSRGIRLTLRFPTCTSGAHQALFSQSASGFEVGPPRSWNCASTAQMQVSKAINEKRARRGLQPRPVRACVIGFPNIGKSALINRLINRRAVASAPKPGVTRLLQVRIW